MDKQFNPISAIASLNNLFDTIGIFHCKIFKIFAYFKNHIDILNSFFILVLFIGIFPLRSYSQVTGHIPDPAFIYREVQEDSFVFVPKNSRLTSPAYYYSSPKISTYQVNINHSGLNILGDAANEPSIAIDQKDPNRIFIGWRQFDTIANNFRQAGNGYSLDGGKTWKVSDPIEPGIFRSDPVLDSDSDGNIYFNSLQQTFQCHVFKTTSMNTWNQKTYAYGGDKQWMVIDKKSRPGISNNNNIYANWSFNYSSCNPGSFTRSLDRGLSYEKCISTQDHSRYGNLTIGSDGTLYLCGFNGDFSISKSTNAWNPNLDFVWDFSNTLDLDGSLRLYTEVNPEGLLGPPWIATDVSNGPTKDNLYLLCSVNRYSKIDKADVMFTRSIDGGQSWSKPIQINDDSLENNWNWFGTMSVAPNGRIDIIWLDSRNDPGGVNSQLFYSNSLDGGLTWSKNEALSDSFNPHLGWPNQKKMGDYFHMVSTNDGAHLAWAATFNGEQDVYYSYIIPDIQTDVINSENAEFSFASLFQNTPNPFNNMTSISYSLRKCVRIKLDILDATLSRTVNTLVDEYKFTGNYSVTWEGLNHSGINVPNGIYFYRLSVAGEKAIYRKTLLMR